jgi:serine/threonine protein kinase
LSGLTTPAYMAPEMIAQMPSSTKIDMWALGVILHQFFNSKLPFEGSSYYETMKLISEKDPRPLPSILSPYIKQIINNLLNKNPENRPDAE